MKLYANITALFFQKQLYQIQINLKPRNTISWQRKSRVFTIFTRKNKRCYVSLPSLSRDHQTVTIMNLNIILFLSAADENRNVKEKFCHPALMGNCLTYSHLSWPFNPVNGLLMVRSRSCVEHEMLRRRGRILVREIWTWNLAGECKENCNKDGQERSWHRNFLDW